MNEAGQTPETEETQKRTLSPEHIAKMREGRMRYLEEKRKAEESGEVTANGHPHLLDIHEPEKWQMKVRMFLESLRPNEAEQWVIGLRVTETMAAKLARDMNLRRVTERCFICEKPFRDGKPAGTAHYTDFDRNLVQVFCCNQAEYPQLLMACQKKDEQREEAEQRANEAARKAMIAVRQGMRTNG